jgi:stage IV sporulation protein FB
VFVHCSVLVVVGLLALLALGDMIFAVLFIACYLAILVVHEYGHAFVARALGYEVDSIWLTPLHGWCVYEAPDYEWDEVLVSWGGVAAQLAVAVPVAFLALAAWGDDWGYLTPIIVVLGYANLVVVAVNLLPSEDLDGKVAWRIVLLIWQRRRARRTTEELLRASRTRKWNGH